MKFKLPEKTDWMVEQNQHGPTIEYAQEINKIVSEVGFTKALEIGCIWAVSTLSILLSQENGTLLSVDPIPQTNPSMHAMVEVRYNELQDRWNYFTGKSEEFWKQNKERFDLIYIDGSHNYTEAKLDLFAAWLCLEKGGVLLADDYLHPHNHDNDYGVSLAVLELMQEKKIKPFHMGKHVIGFEK